MPRHKQSPMTLAGMKARLARLETLRTGMQAELVSQAICADPLTREEQKAYLAAIGAALGGVEAAATALARACHRLAAR